MKLAAAGEHSVDHQRGETNSAAPNPLRSLELNPCEQLWDVLKDTEGFANALFNSIDKLPAVLLPGLHHFWQDSSAVLSLVGRPWLHDQANASAKTQWSDCLEEMVLFRVFQPVILRK